MKLIKITLVSTMFIFLFTTNVFAWLRICNKSSSRVSVANKSSSVSVAIAVRSYRSRGAVMSTGWWNIPSGRCAKVIGGKLDKKKDYYYYAYRHDGRKKWTGEYPFCTSTNKFNLRGEKQAKPGSSYSGECRTTGTQKRFFRRINVGNKNHTIKLTR